MGITLKDDKDLIQDLTINMAPNFTAEIFARELSCLMNEDLLGSLIVRNYGMNTRVESTDILNVDTEFLDDGHYNFKENIVLHLSRNSIYHQLPEILFHPLSLFPDTKSKTTKEVISLIKENREKERVNLKFFSLFDTELFKESIKINKRSLELVSGSSPKKNLIRIFKNILDENLLISDEALCKLFFYVRENEIYKENLPELEKLIYSVLNLDVKMSYIPHYIEGFYFGELGLASLGINLGLNGVFRSEIDDLKIVVFLNKNSGDYLKISNSTSLITEILEWFILSTRKIHISYEQESLNSFIFGENYLGFDAYL